jgi:NADH dehydrogenase FAD-containing subunit
MARILILGAGISGHTAALSAKRKLGKKHEVIVVSPNANYQWVPSNINVDNIGLAIDIRQSFLQQYFRHRHRLRTTTYHFKTDDQ